MRVLIVNAFDADNTDEGVAQLAIDHLRSRGHEVDELRLEGSEFELFMTAEERRAYETDKPLLADATVESAAALARIDALLFCYPSSLFGPPPRLKSWLERVLVQGVAFRFDHKQRVRPGLTQVRRLGAITTSRHSRFATARARDLGRRTFMRTLRLNCHPRCRRTFLRLDAGAPAGRAADRIARSLRGWR